MVPEGAVRISVTPVFFLFDLHPAVHLPGCDAVARHLGPALGLAIRENT